METASNALPEDIESLKALIVNQQALLDVKQRRIEELEAYVILQRQRQFGTSSEKAPGQAELFDEAELLGDASEPEQDEATSSDLTAQAEDQPKARRGHRKPLPAELPRIRIEHDLDEADKTCACGCQRVEMGEEISEQLDIIPAQVRVLVHVRKKYACSHCDEAPKTALLPAQPIPKSQASAGLLAHVAVAKYQDALPLHRQEQILARSGIELPRHTLARWMLKAGTLIQPLLNLLNDQLLAGPIIHADETPVQVLKKPDKPPNTKAYMWVRAGGEDHPIILFHYASSRSAQVITDLLDGYTGYLHTDDYAGYHALGKTESITHVGCWAHARRKFVDAQKVAKGKNAKSGKADMALTLIAQLYRIEKEIKEATVEQRQRRRQQDSVAVLKRLRTWLDKSLHQVLPKSPLGKALGYLNNNWDKLTVYTQDGRLAIDNNRAENAIRPFVIGRKNWLFSDTEAGARASAALYSLIETAKANDQEPYAYLRVVFEKLPQAQTLEDIEALLPWKLPRTE